MVWKNSDFKEILILVIIYEKNSLREREREREREKEREKESAGISFSSIYTIIDSLTLIQCILFLKCPPPRFFFSIYLL